jgi:hypothetical protein
MKSILDRSLSEGRPALVKASELDIDNGLSTVEAVDAGSFVGLQLEEFETSHGGTRRGHHLEFATRCSQHDPGCVDIERLDTTVAQHGQKVNDVEVFNQIIGQFDQGPDEERFSGHCYTDLSG